MNNKEVESETVQERAQADRLMSVAQAADYKLQSDKAAVRRINAEAELLEAQARDTRAQAEHRETVVAGMLIINQLQKMQIEKQMEDFKNSKVPVN